MFLVTGMQVVLTVTRGTVSCGLTCKRLFGWQAAGWSGRVHGHCLTHLTSIPQQYFGQIQGLD